MTRPKPLFIMGNKRSGSTLMADLLNSHANVFVSHESDIAWILTVKLEDLCPIQSKL